MRMSAPSTIDPAGWYTGPQHLYPRNEHYASVASIEGARPWTGAGRPETNHGFTSTMQSATSSPLSSSAVRSAARTDLESVASLHSSSPSVRRMSKEIQWIFIPETRHYRSTGIPGFGSRKGRAESTYVEPVRRPATTMGSRGSSLGFASPLSQPSTPNSSQYGLFGSPTARSLRLDASRASRHESISPGTESSDGQRKRDISRQNSLMSTAREPWRTVPGIGYGGKFYYRP